MNHRKFCRLTLFKRTASERGGDLDDVKNVGSGGCVEGGDETLSGGLGDDFDDNGTTVSVFIESGRATVSSGVIILLQVVAV
jgi:diaminopimelate decarboxylase